ncbi:hypothetical protein M413DRAFT_157520 [Hebeloma cylindrosporum]|uniref:Uncharacterized protein n=1 Tax=Hebeloma cylindrosporum TaxID=76867 RepID=A0A0C2YIT8_HEBCY|nr:hypothetical protein M413DRAFT_157520 [Hebeloma cylindrosporum h7]
MLIYIHSSFIFPLHLFSFFFFCLIRDSVMALWLHPAVFFSGHSSSFFVAIDPTCIDNYSRKRTRNAHATHTQHITTQCHFLSFFVHACFPLFFLLLLLYPLVVIIHATRLVICLSFCELVCQLVCTA